MNTLCSIVQNSKFTINCIYVCVHTHMKCLKGCNTSILILLQDHSICFGYFLYPSSGVQ
jgi:hypothetical protein